MTIDFLHVTSAFHTARWTIRYYNRLSTIRYYNRIVQSTAWKAEPVAYFSGCPWPLIHNSLRTILMILVKKIKIWLPCLSR